MENKALTFSVDDLIKQTDNSSKQLLADILSCNCIISVKVSFQDEHIIYKCPNLEIYNMLINRLENDYNYDNYIIAVYKHYLRNDDEVIDLITTDVIIPRNTALLEDDFIGSLDDLPF